MSKDGWIKHEAGPCPVPPETRVDVKFQDGEISLDSVASEWGAHDRSGADWWKHETPAFEIVAYRVVEMNTGNDE